MVKKLSWWKLLFIAIPFFGISFSWAIQIGHTSAFLLSLGMNKKLLSYTWLAGPISGTIMQPIAGVLSDMCWIPVLNVRRQLYLWIGALICAASLLSFSWADWIGKVLGDKGTNHDIGLIVAVLSFFILDFAVNLIQGPVRVLLVDLAPPEQHTLGSALFSLFNGVGNTLGFLVGAIQFTEISFLQVAYNIRPLYFVGAVVILTVVILNAFFIREQKYIETREELKDEIESLSDDDAIAKDEKNEKLQEDVPKFELEPMNDNDKKYNILLRPFIIVLRGIFAIPSVFYVAFMAQSFCYIANFALYIYGTVYFAVQIYNGNCNDPIGTPSRSRCDDGVLLGNLALSIMAFLSIPISLVIAFASKYVSVKWIWFIGQITQGVCMLLCILVYNKYLAVLLISTMSLSLACMMSIPWSVCSAAIREMQESGKSDARKEGFLLSIFNLSQCLPEFIVGLGGGLTVHLLVEKGSLPIGSQLALYGAIGGLGSAFCILFVKLPKSLNPTKVLVRR